MIVTNPYQEVIDWLRSPEGEKWSEERMLIAKVISGGGLNNQNYYGDSSLLIWKGIFSIKKDDDPRTTAVFQHS